MPRPSPVTDAVRSVIAAEDRHAWALDELLEAVRRRIPTADFSTVFRAMQALERTGVVDQVDLGDGKARYETRREHHEHIRCTVCGSVAEVPGCVVEDAMSQIQRRTGYRVSSHQVVFSGVCRPCRAAARRERTASRSARTG
ncbi:MAG TPA: transcriptional repressor [Candidatus Dormibacteraeota bacterium]|nr:transcriptional repressor [Candidatus Dormibacteraeota bacterium]